MHKNDTLDPDYFLGPDGPIGRCLESYEARPQQIQLAQAIDKAFQGPHHLIAEAGTGVGKSFAYIVPAVAQALHHKQKVIISTHTISLQ